MENKDKEYFILCEAFMNQQSYEKHIKDIVDKIKENGYDIPGDFVGIGSIYLIKEEWQRGCLPIIMDNGHLYIKFLPFELFCARMTVEEFVKTNKEWSMKKFEETNKEIINALQEKIDNNDPNIDIETAKETIKHITKVNNEIDKKRS